MEEEATSAERPASRPALGIDLEDYFQAAAYRVVVPASHWPRFDARVPEQMATLVRLLERTSSRATFFADLWTAEQHSGVLAELMRRRHEVAVLVRDAGEPDIARRTRDAIATATGFSPRGIRFDGPAPGPDERRRADLLAGLGFDYDASTQASAPAIAAPKPTNVARLVPRRSALVPARAYSPIRHLPDPLWRRLIARNHDAVDTGFLLLKSWEIDPDQPRITAGPLAARVLHRHGLARVEARLAAWLATAPAQSIADLLGLARPVPAIPAPAIEPVAVSRVSPEATAARVPVTLVIPAFNEAPTLAYLARALDRFETGAGAGLRLAYIFVDDASTDATFDILQRLFGARADCRILRHPANLGIAGATLTGIGAAQTEIVAVIDADCSYDPEIIARMVPLLAPGVALVTASPYHPLGRVVGVPAWRLWLSRRLSGLYGAVLATRLHTYTACVRVYRKSAMKDLPIRNSGYLGMAEIVVALDARAAHIVECPAVLETRLFGQSKMKIAKTIAGHLGLIANIVATRRHRARPAKLERML